MRQQTHAAFSLHDLLSRTRLQLPVFGVGNRLDVHRLPRGGYIVEIRRTTLAVPRPEKTERPHACGDRY